MTRNLPPGWEWATLGKVCRKPQYGWTTKSEAGEGLPYLRTTDISSGSISWREVPVCVEEPENSDKYLLRDGDVVVSRAGSIGKSLLVKHPPPSVFASYLIRIRPIREMVNSYVAYFLQSPSYWEAISKAQSGIAIPNVNAKKLAAIQIPVSPVSEQRRIVAAIEEHFSRLDAVHIAVEAAQQKLEALLLSVLRETCAGSWPETALFELIVSLKNGVFVSRPSVDPPGMPIYRISAVRPLTLRVSDIRYAHPVPDNADSYAAAAGDVLFTRYSGNPQYVGAAAVVPPEGAEVLHPDKLIRVIADRERVLPEWIAAYVTAGKGRSEIEKRLKTTAGQVGISGSQLKTVPIAVPPLSYQEQAAAKIGLMLSEQERIRQQLAELAKKGQALRRSILADAFSGRLVPQDPDDEPASALLERIHASQDPKGN